MGSAPGAHLPRGLDASDDTQVHDGPGRGQAGQQPPLDGAAVADVGRDVQRPPVPEVAHGAAGLALCLEPWNPGGPVKGWPRGSGLDSGSAGLRPECSSRIIVLGLLAEHQAQQVRPMPSAAQGVRLRPRGLTRGAPGPRLATPPPRPAQAGLVQNMPNSS